MMEMMKMFLSDPMKSEKRGFNPDFETKEQLEIEEEVAEYIQKTSPLICHKLPPREILDFCIVEDEVVRGFCEVRSRNCRWSLIEQGGFYLPLKKLLRIHAIHRINQIKTSLVVVCKDHAYRTWLGSHDDFEVIWWGDRRNDKTHDIEACVVIPGFFFKPFYSRIS